MTSKGKVANDQTALPDTDLEGFVRGFFPSAASKETVLKLIFDHLGKQPEEQERVKNDTLFAQSVCPDEINHEPEDITNTLAEKFCKVFHLGGLGGIPFTGKGGFGAFAHHIPKDGNLFVLFAPHIGVTNEKALGQYHRAGQCEAGTEDPCKPSTACGAAAGALKYCKAIREGNTVPERRRTSWGRDEEPSAKPFTAIPLNGPTPCPCILMDPDDYQMDFIKLRVDQRYDTIIEAGKKARVAAEKAGVTDVEELEKAENNAEQAALVEVMYDIAMECLETSMTFDLGDDHFVSKIYVLGGIQINMPGVDKDLFEPKMFKLFTRNSEPVDLETEVGIAPFSLGTKISAVRGHPHWADKDERSATTVPQRGRSEDGLGSVEQDQSLNPPQSQDLPADQLGESSTQAVAGGPAIPTSTEFTPAMVGFLQLLLSILVREGLLILDSGEVVESLAATLCSASSPGDNNLFIKVVKLAKEKGVLFMNEDLSEEIAAIGTCVTFVMNDKQGNPVVTIHATKTNSQTLKILVASIGTVAAVATVATAAYASTVQYSAYLDANAKHTSKVLDTVRQLPPEKLPHLERIVIATKIEPPQPPGAALREVMTGFADMANATVTAALNARPGTPVSP